MLLPLLPFHKGARMLPLLPFHMVRVSSAAVKKLEHMALVSLRFHAVLPYTTSSSECI